MLIFCSLESISPKTISTIGGIHQMLGLHEYGFAAVARDSIQCLPVCDGTNKVGASFDTPCGRRLVIWLAWFLDVLTSDPSGLFLSLPFLRDYFLNISKLIIYLQIKPAEYMEMISSLRPNLWATLADEVPAWVSDKRNKTSVDRTIKWLDECIALSPVKSVYVLFLALACIITWNPSLECDKLLWWMIFAVSHNILESWIETRFL